MQESIFDQNKTSTPNKPLADELRPNSLDEYVGQEKLVGEDGIIRKLIESDNIASMILWGPPGVGKTTLAKIIANETESKFLQVSAVSSGKKDLKNVIVQAKEVSQFQKGRKTILFIDEIHRFNKIQQDYLLPFVEDGTVTLVGATTENPSFEVIAPLLSRTRVYILSRHSEEDLSRIIDRAIEFYKENRELIIKIDKDTRNFMIVKSNGDPRMLLNAFELGVNLTIDNSPTPSFKKREVDLSNSAGKNPPAPPYQGGKIVIDKKLLEQVFQSSSILYDKNGEEHYNIASALIKSMRASDPNAAVYWLARMVEAGEDPKFIARRCLILASEDVGNADPNALILANAAFEAVNKIGWPESRIILSQLVIYLAKAPKDNSAYLAIDSALADAKETMNLPVPLHLRNAPTKLMKNIGYGKGYVYDHNVEGKKSGQQCLPDELKDRKYLDLSI